MADRNSIVRRPVARRVSWLRVPECAPGAPALEETGGGSTDCPPLRSEGQAAHTLCFTDRPSHAASTGTALSTPSPRGRAQEMCVFPSHWPQGAGRAAFRAGIPTAQQQQSGRVEALELGEC